MKLNELLEKISSIRKATYTKVMFKSIKKPLAKHKGDLIEKVTYGTYRIGIQYNHMQENIGRQTGPLKGTNEQWLKGFENYIIEDNVKGTYKLRLYTPKNENLKPTVKWYLNGVETTKQWLLDNGYLGKQSSQPTNLFNVMVENVIAIG